MLNTYNWVVIAPLVSAFISSTTSYQFVPHKAVAEVSRIDNYRRGELL